MSVKTQLGTLFAGCCPRPKYEILPGKIVSPSFVGSKVGMSA